MQAELQHDAQTYGEYYAAVDLGSNSFHMVIAVSYTHLTLPTTPYV